MEAVEFTVEGSEDVPKVHLCSNLCDMIVKLCFIDFAVLVPVSVQSQRILM